MPSINLYNRLVTFHSWGSPLHATGDYQSHSIWNRMSSMVSLQPHFLQASFEAIAAGFAWTGLTASNGETSGSTGGWPFNYSENLAYRYGQAHAYVADMHRAFYAAKGLDYSRYVFMPQDAGGYGKDAPYSSYIQTLHQTVGALIPGYNADGVVRGSTGDRLSVFSWTGPTGVTQDNVLNMSIYSNEGVTRFTDFCTGTLTGFAHETGLRSNVAAPIAIAYDNEDVWNTSTPVWWLENGSTGNEYGAFLQTLNDPRVNTYKFFDGRCTLRELWGATGNTSQSFRSLNQYSFAYTLTGPDDRGGISVTSDAYVDVIYSQRVNSINYAPNYTMLIDSILNRHRQHLIATSWRAWHANGTLVGNYELSPSTRRYPSIRGKFPQWIYTCDVSCTASPDGHAASVTGTFPLDYASPGLYLRITPDVQQWLPGIGDAYSSSLYKNYSGAYGTTLARIGATGGLYSQGQVLADYIGFLQRCGSVGFTAMQGGGTAQGYTGANITDFIDYSLRKSQYQINNARSALNYFNDNSSKPIIPWIGNSTWDVRQTSLFSLTGSLQSTVLYPDVNGLTGFTVPGLLGTSVSVPSYGTMINLQYNIDLIKWCIKTHNITDFFIFEAAFNRSLATTYGIAAADFWNDVFESLIADSAIEYPPGVSTTSGAAGAVAPVSMIFFKGKFYTREQYQTMLLAFYPNL